MYQLVVPFDQVKTQPNTEGPTEQSFELPSSHARVVIELLRNAMDIVIDDIPGQSIDIIRTVLGAFQVPSNSRASRCL